MASNDYLKRLYRKKGETASSLLKNPNAKRMCVPRPIVEESLVKERESNLARVTLKPVQE